MFHSPEEMRAIESERLDALANMVWMERTLWTVLIALGAILIAYLVGQILVRRARMARLRAFADGGAASTETLRDGWNSTMVFCGQGGSLRIPSVVAGVSRRWVVLALASDYRGTPCLPGSPVVVEVVGDTAAYTFESIIKDRKLTEDGWTLYLTRPMWLQKIQRRRFFRIPVHIPATVALESENGDGQFSHRALIDNLSAGGCRLALPMQIAEGTIINVHPATSIPGTGNFTARVVKSMQTGTDDPPDYQAQCEFLGVSEYAREALVRYCFDVERGKIQERRRG